MPGSCTISASAPTSATSCAQLARFDRETEYVLICQAARPRARAPRSARTSASKWTPRGPTRSASRSRCRWTLVRTRADIFHEPHYVLPPLTPCRSVVTIHDCIHLRFPQYLPKRGALAYARAQMGTAARRSDRILTVSEASKRDILELLRRAAREDHRHPQRASTSGSPPRRRKTTMRARRRSAISCRASSCCTSATSSRTRTSSG